MEKLDIKFKCNKCGKILDKDKEDSDENWSIYKTKEPCECGGKFKMVFNKTILSKDYD